MSADVKRSDRIFIRCFFVLLLHRLFPSFRGCYLSVVSGAGEDDWRCKNGEEKMNSRDIVLFFRRRLWVIVSLCVVTPLGLWLWGWYRGPWRIWVNYYATGAIYEVFWCLVVFLFRPRGKDAVKIAAGVFIATCILEVLQLWEAGFLESIRATFVGKALIGTSFVWWQFPYYVAGSLAGLLWLKMLGREAGVQGYEKDKRQMVSRNEYGR